MAYLAQDCDYALTGGVYSRFPPQPFGGLRLSGTGVQAGGPDYLKQFMVSRVGLQFGLLTTVVNREVRRATEKPPDCARSSWPHTNMRLIGQPDQTQTHLFRCPATPGQSSR